MNPFRDLLKWYFSKNSLPYWCILILDCLVLLASGTLAYWLFNKTQAMVTNRFDVLYTLLFYAALSLVGARIFRTYSGIVRYSSFVDLLNVAYANALTAVLAIISSVIFEETGLTVLAALSLTETCTMFIIATLAMWAIRVVVKALYDVSFSDRRLQRVLIYGTLDGAVGLAKYIRSQQPRRFVLNGFISHDKRAEHIMLMGKRVYNVNESLSEVIRLRRIQAVLVSPLRTEEFREDQYLQNLLIAAGCKIYMAQGVKEASVTGGHLKESAFANIQLNEVSVEDLLPRQEIEVDMESVGQQLHGRRVLITGSAGSIGSEMVRQVAHFQPEEMMLVDQAETPEHDIRLMMAHDFPDVKATTVVTSICNQERMEHIFSQFRPHYVFHAAAYKHVPMMEDNPSEAVHNNIYGTKVIADLSAKYGVEKFVMVSTDKAVNPTNVMGCSKRICEIYVQSLNKYLQSKEQNGGTVATQFVTTRFGNVLGSNGSVIPLFKEQIRKGGPVTVTDKRIVRFFMLIPEACKLVLEAGTKGNGGEIFVFDMGKPVKIADLAQRMIMLSGATNVKIEYTGLREGEKLYEEVLNELEGTKPTFHKKIRIAEVREYDYQEIAKQINELIDIAQQFDDMATVKKMKEIVPEYKSNNSKYEELDKA